MSDMGQDLTDAHSPPIHSDDVELVEINGAARYHNLAGAAFSSLYIESVIVQGDHDSSLPPMSGHKPSPRIRGAHHGEEIQPRATQGMPLSTFLAKALVHELILQRWDAGCIRNQLKEDMLYPDISNVYLLGGSCDVQALRLIFRRFPRLCVLRLTSVRMVPGDTAMRCFSPNKSYEYPTLTTLILANSPCPKNGPGPELICGLFPKSLRDLGVKHLGISWSSLEQRTLFDCTFEELLKDACAACEVLELIASDTPSPRLPSDWSNLDMEMNVTSFKLSGVLCNSINSKFDPVLYCSVDSKFNPMQCIIAFLSSVPGSVKIVELELQCEMCIGFSTVLNWAAIDEELVKLVQRRSDISIVKFHVQLLQALPYACDEETSMRWSEVVRSMLPQLVPRLLHFVPVRPNVLLRLSSSTLDLEEEVECPAGMDMFPYQRQ